jgi:hypothetical protein
MVEKNKPKLKPRITETERKKLRAELEAEEIKKAKAGASISTLNSDELEQLDAGIFKEDIEALA